MNLLLFGAKCVYFWLVCLASYSSAKTPYFCPVPLIFSRQLVFDSSTRRWLKFRVRTRIDRVTFRQVFYQAEYDLSLIPQWKTFRTSANGSGLILDLGANIGLTSVLFAQQFPHARVICVEMDPENYKCLRENIALNGIENAEIINCAVSGFNGFGVIANPTNDNNAYMLVAKEDGDVTVSTIAELIKASGPHDADSFLFVKMDIEGSEKEVFSANTDWLRNTDLLVIEPHDWMLPNQKSFAPVVKSLAGFVDREFIIHRSSLVVFRV